MTATAENTKSNTTRNLRGSNLLPELAAQANRAYADAAKASRRSLEHAIEAGRVLNEAQGIAGRGHWQTWLKDNCPKISRQRANECIRLWTHKGQLSDIGQLGLVAALKAIAKKLPDDEAPDETDVDDTEYEGEDQREDGKNSVSLEEWRGLSIDEQREYLQPHNFPGKARFNEQTTAGIEWAQWSWNPVTGCLHDCPYCYARDIAQRFTNAFPFAFAPAFRPDALNAPGKMQVPESAVTDTRMRNVFTCSMADLFGRWVPKEWIEAVLSTVRQNPQWNFLFLTKFPKRMAEFEIPSNAWMGTTVDLQARVANAETAFERLKGHKGVRWLSIEPLLEPLKFKRLDLFNWIVIGGASASSKTPEWRPPLDWILDLHAQARAAGLAIYEKDNLYGNRMLELPFDAPIIGDPTEAPAVFKYLGKE